MKRRTRFALSLLLCSQAWFAHADNIIRMDAPIREMAPPQIQVPENASPGFQKAASQVTEYYYTTTMAAWKAVNPQQMVLYPNANWGNPGQNTWFWASVVCSPVTETWDFFYSADDAGSLYVDGTKVVNANLGFGNRHRAEFSMPKGCHKLIVGLDNLGEAWGWVTFEMRSKDGQLKSTSSLSQWTMISPANGQGLGTPPKV